MNFHDPQLASTPITCAKLDFQLRISDFPLDIPHWLLMFVLTYPVLLEIFLFFT